MEGRRPPEGGILSYLCRLAKEYGDVVRLTWDGAPVYMMNHPDHVLAVLLTHQRQFVRSGGPARLERLLGQGLLRSQGELHQRQRRLAQPAFRSEPLQRFGAQMIAEAARFFDGFREREDFHLRMTQLTLFIVARVFFSLERRAEIERLGRAVQTAILTLDKGRLEWLRRFRFGRACDRLDAFLYELVNQRRKDPTTKDLLGELVASRDSEGDGQAMDDERLRDELMTLLIAGHETTASALAWTGYCLAGAPEMQEALRKEVGDRPLAADDGGKFPGVRGAFAEALRLYPPAWILFRRALSDQEIGGFRVPPGTHILLSPYVMGRDARFYPEPERFDPSRWLPAAEAARPKGTFFPFGLGNRRCLGEAFAWQEGTLLTASLLQSHRWRLPEGTKVDAHPLFTLRPKNGMPLVFRRCGNGTASRHTIKT